MTAFMWALITACVWGVVPILEKIGLSKTDPLTGLFYRCLGVVAGLLLLAAVILKPQQIKSVNMQAVPWLILGGFLASFVGQIAFYKSLKLGEISRVVPITGSYPLIAFVLGILFFGESLTLIKGAGIFLITLGIWALKIG